MNVQRCEVLQDLDDHSTEGGGVSAFGEGGCSRASASARSRNSYGVNRYFVTWLVHRGAKCFKMRQNEVKDQSATETERYSQRRTNEGTGVSIPGQSGDRERRTFHDLAKNAGQLSGDGACFHIWGEKVSDLRGF